MQYDEFISKVAQRTGWEREQAEAVTRATLATLSARITSGEADDLAAQLPQELKSPLSSGPAKAVPFDVAEFKRRLAEHAAVPEDQAEKGIRAVFATLSEAVTGGEFDDVLSQLPNDYRSLVTAPASS
jgi:uncharacterized protein (DUF2267 family)